MRRETMRPELVEFIPRSLDDGVLYISNNFHTASHLCACGCGTKIVTPLKETEYELRLRGSSASLYPSIGNWDHPCQSHYLIRNNRVIWAARMSRAQIERGRAVDEALRNKHYEHLKWPWWRRAWAVLKSLLN